MNGTPGITARHAVITTVCRQNRGLEGAIDEALARIRETYLEFAGREANATADWHVILTVERASSP